MPGEMRRIAGLVDIKIVEDRWDTIVGYCSLDWMKANATTSVPLLGCRGPRLTNSHLHLHVRTSDQFPNRR